MQTTRSDEQGEMSSSGQGGGRRLKRLGAAAGATALIGGLLATGAAGVAAASSNKPAASGSTQGTVVSIDSSADSFVIRTSSGSRVTVKVTSSTSYSESGVSKPTFADVQVRDSVAVIGSTSNGVDTASVVIIGHKVAGGGGFGGGGFGRRGTFGRVTSVDSSDDSFKVQTFNGSTVTVKVTSKTTYRDSAASSAGFSDVKVGETVVIIGSTSNGVETATSVVIGTPGGFGGGGFGGGGFGGGTFGTVTAVDSSKDTFTLKTASGSSVTVKVTSTTTFRDRAASNAGFSDVKVGESVAVTGSTSNGVETATSVTIGLPSGVGGFGGGTFGKVTTVDASHDSFTLKTASGSTLTVKVTSSTTYRDRTVTHAGFSDIKVGESVAVIGSTSNGVETATSVIIGFAGGPPGSRPSGSSAA